MTPATTPPSATPTDDPVRAALRDPRTLEELRNAARVLLRRVRPGMPQTLLAQVADDVVSRTTAAALTGRFDPARGTSVSAWLAGIARNMVKKETCGRQPVSAPSASWDNVLADAAPTPADQAVTRSEGERVRAALGQLEPNDRQLLEMHHFDELTATEIGRRLNASAATIRVRLHRARTALKGLLTPSRREGDS